MSLPDLRHLLSINSENAWSDLLATLLDSDQDTTRQSLGIPGTSPLLIRREVSRSRSRKKADRPDIVIESGGRTVAVIEVKLLAGLGDEQLERYHRYVPEPDRGQCQFLAISLRGLRLNTEYAREWRNATWEDIVAAFTRSPIPWVATTAAAWLHYLNAQVPSVDGTTVWNEIGRTDLYLALRLRSAYIHDHVTLPPGSIKFMQEIGSGGLYVAGVDAPIEGSGYAVRWEVTEHLPTQDVARLPDGSGLGGPEVRFRLVQQNVTTSRHYDWEHLHRLWQEYLKSEEWIQWRPYPPRKRHPWELDGVAMLRSLGSPRFLGCGYGEGQARLSGEVELGACFVMTPTSTLREVTDVLSRVAVIGARMARHPVQPRTIKYE